MEFPGLSGFMTKDPATDDPGHKWWLHSKFNYPKFQHTTLLPVPYPFLIIICPRPSTPTSVSGPRFNLSGSSELRINAEDISSEEESQVLVEEQWHQFSPSLAQIGQRPSKSVLSSVSNHLKGRSKQHWDLRSYFSGLTVNLLTPRRPFLTNE